MLMSSRRALISLIIFLLSSTLVIFYLCGCRCVCSSTRAPRRSPSWRRRFSRPRLTWWLLTWRSLMARGPYSYRQVRDLHTIRAFAVIGSSPVKIIMLNNLLTFTVSFFVSWCIIKLPYFAEPGETEHNLPKTLKEFSVVDGTRLNCDDFLQNYTLALTILHRYSSASNGSK